MKKLINKLLRKKAKVWKVGSRDYKPDACFDMRAQKFNNTGKWIGARWSDDENLLMGIYEQER